MAGICCENDQVNSGGICAKQCLVAQVMNENRVCGDCLLNMIVNAAGDKCLVDCATEGEITNAAGNACLTSCAIGGETPDFNGDNQCDGVLPNLLCYACYFNSSSFFSVKDFSIHWTTKEFINKD